MKFSVSPIVKVAVSTPNASDIIKLVNGMRKLSQTDSIVRCLTDQQTGENIIIGSGELHLEILLRDLEIYSGVPIIRQDPIVSYKETLTQKSSQEVMAKSSNKHNRIFMTAGPIDPSLATAIEDEEITLNMDPKELSKILVDQYGLTKQDTQNIWAFGPLEESGCNILID